jgi:hypothetical protein
MLCTLTEQSTTLVPQALKCSRHTLQDARTPSTRECSTATLLPTLLLGTLLQTARYVSDVSKTRADRDTIGLAFVRSQTLVPTEYKVYT